MANKSKKPKNTERKIQNRRARFDYELDDSLAVGIQLTGAETKSLRMGHGQLRGAYVIHKDGELWLINAQINGAQGIIVDETQQIRNRKLLAKRKQIDNFIANKQQGMTIVPIEFLTQGRFITLKIALGKGKKHYDKREALKRRDHVREIHRQFS